MRHQVEILHSFVNETPSGDQVEILHSFVNETPSGDPSAPAEDFLMLKSVRTYQNNIIECVLLIYWSLFIGPLRGVRVIPNK